MKRAHDMPFGAAVQPDGRVRFALWAPAARDVTLLLEGGRLPMEATGQGWFQLTTEAAPGARYRYALDGRADVPDPASRLQPDDVHGASAVVDPRRFDWPDTPWRGRPWEEAVIYELHVGAFTPSGTYRGAIERLDHLAALGVTAIELMPLGECPGARNWGYDGVYPYAPEQRYGTPDELKQLVVAAQARGLMVLLDVVYNHFGPEGNYIAGSAPQFFTDAHTTPWGAALDMDSDVVRAYFIHNALYWLEEFGFDGLRLDAVHAIKDDRKKHILTELAEAVHARDFGRPIHLVLENDDNAATHLARDLDGRPLHYAAQWNDDMHHALHVALTGETHSYYRDYAKDPIGQVAHGLAEGFVYQGECSLHRGRARGTPSAHLPPTAFVNFLQNHDQIGNRPAGERIVNLASADAVRAGVALLLLAPPPPLLFMGEEWGSTQPFCFFCDFEPELAKAVREGRAREFAGLFGEARGRAAAEANDATDPATFERCVLRWDDLHLPVHDDWLRYYRFLLDLRRREIVPRLAGAKGLDWQATPPPDRALRVRWRLGDDAVLGVTANLSDAPCAAIGPPPLEQCLFEVGDFAQSRPELLPRWSVIWSLVAKPR
jgi:maltooligosyltrehalose trehalohydrolase